MTTVIEHCVNDAMVRPRKMEMRMEVHQAAVGLDASDDPRDDIWFAEGRAHEVAEGAVSGQAAGGRASMPPARHHDRVHRAPAQGRGLSSPPWKPRRMTGGSLEPSPAHISARGIRSRAPAPRPPTGAGAR